MDDLLASPHGRSQYAFAEFVISRSEKEYRDKILAHLAKPHFIPFLVVFLATIEKNVVANLAGLLYKFEADPKLSALECQDSWMEARVLHALVGR